MSLLQPSVCLKSLSTAKFDPKFTTFSSISGHSCSSAVSFPGISLCAGEFHTHNHYPKPFPCFAVSTKSDPGPDPEVPRSKPRSRAKESDGDKSFPSFRPRKPKRGRKSEADLVEDYIRGSLGRTFETMRQQNPEVFENRENVMKPRSEDEFDDAEEEEEEEEDDDEESSEDEEDEGSDKRGKKMVVEEEDPNWPLDADVGWGIRASEYFEKHPIKNVVGEDGFEVDWEGEIDDNWVQEINCLEWESFAFHPSPLVVLVFERYNRATHNWKTLKELEKAIKVYWSAKDRLPPRAVKLDINIERDMAYALKVRDCPQILFLQGNRIMYREKEFRTCDELVQMIAHFYYKAKMPSWINEAHICAPY